jgi:hypothetical protein
MRPSVLHLRIAVPSGGVLVGMPVRRDLEAVDARTVGVKPSGIGNADYDEIAANTNDGTGFAKARAIASDEVPALAGGVGENVRRPGLDCPRMRARLGDGRAGLRHCGTSIGAAIRIDYVRIEITRLAVSAEPA